MPPALQGFAALQVDEASMLDLALGAALLDALPHSCQLVLVGAAAWPAPRICLPAFYG